MASNEADIEEEDKPSDEQAKEEEIDTSSI